MTDTTINSEDFLITEVPGQQATPEQMSMFYTRYRFLAGFCAGRDILEVACGGGQGLGYLARVARSVSAGDVDERILPFVRTRYLGRPAIQVQKLDAHDLPFKEGSFDVVAMLDAIYWLRDQEQFVREARRVLRPGGVLLVTTVNRHWNEFNPSPFATRYLDAVELEQLLIAGGFSVETHVAFAAAPTGLVARGVGTIRHIMVKWRLVPTSIRLKALLKRMFIGRLAPIPEEVVDDMAPYSAPMPLGAAFVRSDWKLIYAVARRSP